MLIYRLTWQTRDRWGWTRPHTVFGDINAVHSLYNSLVRNEYLSKESQVVAAVWGLSQIPGEDDTLIYEWGNFQDWESN